MQIVDEGVWLIGGCITRMNGGYWILDMVGKQLVFKQYRNKTVVTRYPDMSRVKPSPAQKNRRQVFAEGVAYAKAINNDPVRKAEYLQKMPKWKTVYQFALKEYLQK